MTSWKMQLGAVAIALLAANVGSGPAQAAPAIGAGNIADAVNTSSSSAVETVRSRGRHGRNWGHRRYGGGYGHYGRRHWRRRHHDGFPAALLLGGLLGAGLGYGGYGYGYGGGCW